MCKALTDADLLDRAFEPEFMCQCTVLEAELLWRLAASVHAVQTGRELNAMRARTGSPSKIAQDVFSHRELFTRRDRKVRARRHSSAHRTPCLIGPLHCEPHDMALSHALSGPCGDIAAPRVELMLDLQNLLLRDRHSTGVFEVTLCALAIDDSDIAARAPLDVPAWKREHWSDADELNESEPELRGQALLDCDDCV